MVMKVNRIKLIHTKERKNTKKEPIPAPKCPEEKNTVIQDTSYRNKPSVERRLLTDKSVQNGIKHLVSYVINIMLNSYVILPLDISVTAKIASSISEIIIGYV